MKNYSGLFFKFFAFAAACVFISACEKEHLEPPAPIGISQEPLVYISGVLDGDSIYFAGGVNSYVGDVAVIDTLTWRYFTFFL